MNSNLIYIGVAALVAVVLGVGGYFFVKKDDVQTQQQTQQAPAQGQQAPADPYSNYSAPSKP